MAGCRERKLVRDCGQMDGTKVEFGGKGKGEAESEGISVCGEDELHVVVEKMESVVVASNASMAATVNN